MKTLPALNDTIFVLVGTTQNKKGLAIVEAKVVQLGEGRITAACEEGLVPNILMHKSDDGIEFYYATKLYAWERGERINDFLDVEVNSEDHKDYGVVVQGLEDLNRAVFALEFLRNDEDGFSTMHAKPTVEVGSIAWCIFGNTTDGSGADLRPVKVLEYTKTELTEHYAVASARSFGYYVGQLKTGVLYCTSAFKWDGMGSHNIGSYLTNTINETAEAWEYLGEGFRGIKSEQELMALIAYTQAPIKRAIGRSCFEMRAVVTKL